MIVQQKYAALKKRGNITLWFSDGAFAYWQHQGPLQPGAQFHYSDWAIQTALTVKTIYHLGFRQTEGFLRSMAKLMGVVIDIPDYSTRLRRQNFLTVPLATSSPRESVHNGVSKRRTWRKPHVVVNEATVKL